MIDWRKVGGAMIDWQKRAEVLEATLRAVRAERDDARGALSQRIALRRDIEEILGVESGPASDEQLARGVEAARRLRQRAETAESLVSALLDASKRVLMAPGGMEDWEALVAATGEPAQAVAARREREIEASTLRRYAATMRTIGVLHPSTWLGAEADRIEAEALASPARKVER